MVYSAISTLDVFTLKVSSFSVAQKHLTLKKKKRLKYIKTVKIKKLIKRKNKMSC